jgi:hypothetical protein
MQADQVCPEEEQRIEGQTETSRQSHPDRPRKRVTPPEPCQQRASRDQIENCRYRQQPYSSQRRPSQFQYHSPRVVDQPEGQLDIQRFVVPIGCAVYVGIARGSPHSHRTRTVQLQNSITINTMGAMVRWEGEAIKAGGCDLIQ